MNKRFHEIVKLKNTHYAVFFVTRTVHVVHLVVILIWLFGGFSSDRQIKITANAVVLSEVLINSNDK